MAFCTGSQRAFEVVAHHAFHVRPHPLGLLALGDVAQHAHVAAEAAGAVGHGPDAAGQPLGLAPGVGHAHLAVHLALVGQGVAPQGQKLLAVLGYDAVQPAQTGERLQRAAGLPLHPLVGENQPAARIGLEHAHRGLPDEPGQAALA
jgi:hypothetical protein